MYASLKTFLGACGLAAGCAMLLAGPAAGAQRVLYVAPHAKKSDLRCTRSAPCRTIERAVVLARPGSEIVVRGGTYDELVLIAKRVALVGRPGATVDAIGRKNAILISGARAAGSSVSGFRLLDATEEGILAINTSHLRIRGNVVRGNDRGLTASPLAGQCAPQGAVPGDCGEGLHLVDVSYSTVASNTVSENAGGILLTDETGPTSHNSITKNRVTGNVLDCGITLAGHNARAVTLSTAPGPPTVAALAPTVGGVFDNRITDNVVDGNGTKGLGAGIGLFGGAPGTAVYDNEVSGNTAEGNGLGGVTLHSHAPGQDLDGNSIVANVLSNDGLHGYPSGAPGDEDAGLAQTAAIILFSASTKLSSTTVARNRISREEVGIWTENVPVIPPTANTFASTVRTPLVQR